MMGPLLIEGYAAVFGVADTAGDVVRAGAFAQSLRQGRGPPHAASTSQWRNCRAVDACS